MAFHHRSVLLQESVEALRIRPDGVYVDGTLGGGGHSALLCESLSPEGTLIGIDRDTVALEAATARLKDYSCRKELVHQNFFQVKAVLNSLSIPNIDGAILDLGVSSPQLDDSTRGFSYHQEARLDMRMDRQAPLSAWQVVNTYDESRLADILFRYGEERYARRIAAAICQQRSLRPIETTTELSEIIKHAFPPGKRFGDKHPAKRSFQAIRIEVNGELEGLDKAIKDFVEVLKPGGRLAVITFHSLEDRIVKTVFADFTKGCECPKDFPVCVCGKQAQAKPVTRKPIIASEKELHENNRAHSAKLRVLEKL